MLPAKCKWFHFSWATLYLATSGCEKSSLTDIMFCMFFTHHRHNVDHYESTLTAVAENDNIVYEYCRDVKGMFKKNDIFLFRCWIMPLFTH